jgi:hypothetical protein
MVSLSSGREFLVAAHRTYVVIHQPPFSLRQHGAFQFLLFLFCPAGKKEITKED